MELGWGMEGYMELKVPVLKGSLEPARAGPGVGAGPGVPGEPMLDTAPDPPDPSCGGSALLLPPGRFWLRSFSSRRHLARRLENHTCKHCDYCDQTHKKIALYSKDTNKGSFSVNNIFMKVKCFVSTK